MTAGSEKVIASTILCEDAMPTYCSHFTSVLADVRRQVYATLPKAATESLHNLRPWDYLLVKVLRQKSWKVSKLQGPFQVLLMTQTHK